MTGKRFSIQKVVRISIVLVTVCIVTAAAYTWNQKRSEPPVRCKDCNVIVVSLDTLSGTHIPCYGYARNTAPNLCAFAAENIFFTHAYGNATYTLPGHVSMFTGLYPHTHGVMRAEADRLSVDTRFLPSILKQNGYYTLFYMPETPHLPWDLVYNRGIDVYLDADEKTWADAEKLFEQKVSEGKKTFLFLHTYAVHPPFREDGRPNMYTSDSMPWMMIRESDVRDVSKDFVAYMIVAIRNDLINGVHKGGALPYELLLRSLEASEGNYEKQKRLILRSPDILKEYRLKYDPLIRIDVTNKRELSYLQALYDQKIHEFDEGLLRDLLAFVSKDSVRNNTVVIITSDHGEEFGEHGYINHTSLYDQNTRVVLVMAVPGIKSRRITEYVQTTDITPTILGLVGIQSGPFQGDNLQGVLTNGHLPQRVMVADMTDMQTLRLGKWKLFVDMRAGVNTPIELYDTQSDPAELQNVLFSNMQLAAKMIVMYRQFEENWTMKVP